MIEFKEQYNKNNQVTFLVDNETVSISENKIKEYINNLRHRDSVHLVTANGQSKILNKFIDLDKSLYKIKPYSHQLEAINYGLNSKDSWLLLDDCGLGKTISMIYLAEELKRTKNIEHCLIICGVNSLKYNWADEIEKFSNLSYTILGQKITKTGKKRIATVKERCEILKNKIDEFFIITNIESMQSKDFIKAYNSSKNKFDMIVLDEAHHLKNPSSQSAKTLLKMKADYRIALTGTIIMNVPENSFVALKWTGNTNSTYTEFKRTFNVVGGFGGVQVIGHKNLDLLQQLIASCSLRRRKEDVLDLPDKTYQIEYVELLPQQQKLYDDVSEGILAELDKLDHIPTTMEEITINMRRRQITAYPGSLSSDVTCSAKLDRLEELVEEITNQGDKVLIFNSFKSAADEEYKRLEKYNPVLCTGAQPDDIIAINKNTFKEDDSCKVMIATWQKMGTGHTLTPANYCIFVDTPWTQADFDQASDRIYRIGQNKKVTIITLIAKDTYDERVQEILINKECLSSYLVDNKVRNPSQLNIIS